MSRIHGKHTLVDANSKGISFAKHSSHCSWTQTKPTVNMADVKEIYRWDTITLQPLLVGGVTQRFSWDKALRDNLNKVGKKRYVITLITAAKGTIASQQEYKSHDVQLN